MSDKYLNENCIFQCNQCVEGIPFKAKEPFPTNVNVNGCSILTNSVLISATAPGSCRLRPNPQGTPPYLPCTINVVKWNMCSRNSANNMNLLTDKSVGKCIMPGGEISVRVATTVMCVQDEKKIRQLQAHDFILLEEDSSETKRKQHDKTVNSSLYQEELRNPNLSNQINSNKTDNIVVDEVKDELIQEDRKIMKCPYSSEKEKCKSCRYANSPTDRVLSMQMEDSSKTPSQILRANYRKYFNELEETRRYYKNKYSSYEEEINLFVDNLAGNEAHHIVSTNDVLLQPSAKFVLQLVNFYGFNINDAYNCILLAGNGDRGSFGSFVEEKKLEEKFRTMNKVKRQWHGGGHKFTVDDENFEGDYATKVTELLVQSMSRLSDSKCRSDDKYYEKGKIEFEKKMWAVVDYVRKHLVSFEQNPKKSQPYYVSEAAFLFAYGLRKVNFVVISSTESGTYVVSKYTASQKVSNTESLLFDLKGEKQVDITSDTDIKRLILFLGRINIALVDQTFGDVHIPFSIKDKIEISMCGMQPQDFLKKVSNSLIISFFNIDRSENEEKNIMLKRLKEVKGGGI